MSLKNLLAVLIFLVGPLFGSTLRAGELNIDFKTTPPSKLLRAFVDPTDLSLLITDTGGRPIEQGTVAIRLEAPRPGRFFSTDFPLVEGTVLSEMRLPVRQGRANWRQLFPIRGAYRLSVEVVAGDGSKASKTFVFDVRENQKKWLALAVFSAGLVVLGFVAGRVFTGARVSVASVMAAGALLIGSPGMSRAQQPAGMAALQVEPARVGQPSGVRWRLPGNSAAGGRAALLTLTITHLEKKKVVFAVEKIAVAGEWSMKFHFPDGGEYRVAAVGNVPGLAPVRNEQVVNVVGVEPPAGAMVPVLSFFIALIAVGLGLGRWSKLRAAVPI